MCRNDGYLVIRSGELCCGQLEKSALGGGKNNIFQTLLRDFSYAFHLRLIRLFCQRGGCCGSHVEAGEADVSIYQQYWLFYRHLRCDAEPKPR